MSFGCCTVSVPYSGRKTNPKGFSKFFGIVLFVTRFGLLFNQRQETLQLNQDACPETTRQVINTV